MKRWLTTALAAALCMMALGCAEKDEGVQYIQTTKKTMEKIESVHIVNSEELRIQVDGKEHLVTSSQDYVAQYEPLAVHSSSRIQYASHDTALEIFLMEEEDTITVYQNDGTGWKKQEVLSKKVKTKPTAKGDTLTEIQDCRDFKLVSVDTVEGRQVARISATIKKEYLDQVKSAIVGGNFLGQGIEWDKRLVNKAFEGISTPPILFYVDVESGLLLSEEIDMTETIRQFYQNAKQESEETLPNLVIDRYIWRKEFQDINQEVTITVPQEAKDGQEAEIVQ